jgi:hypothetical protein
MDDKGLDSYELKIVLNKLDEIRINFEELRKKTENKLNNQWLDNQEMLLQLGVSKRTLQYYRDNGMLPFSQVGRKIFYKMSDVQKLLHNNYLKLPNF